MFTVWRSITCYVVGHGKPFLASAGTGVILTEICERQSADSACAGEVVVPANTVNSPLPADQ